MADLDIMAGADQEAQAGVKPAEIPQPRSEPKIESRPQREVKAPEEKAPAKEEKLPEPSKKPKLSLRETIDSAREEVTAKERDATGKFVKRESREAAKSVEAAPIPAAPGEKLSTVQAPGTKPVYKAPVGWTKEAKDAFESLPEAVKASVHKREEEVSKGFAGSRQWKDKSDRIDSFVDKYVPDNQTMGTKEQIVERTLAWFSTLRHHNREFAANQLMRIIKDFGLFEQVRNEFVSATQQQQQLNQQVPQQRAQTNDPRVEQLTKTVQQLQQSANQQSFQAAKSMVDTWAADKEHFSQLREKMFELFDRGFVPLESDGTLSTKNLDEAYNMAVRMDPSIQQQFVEAELAKKREELEAQLRNERTAAHSQNARTASQSIKPQPPVTISKPGSTPNRKMSVREAIDAALREQRR
jgi:hypothetical protein